MLKERLVSLAGLGRLSFRHEPASVAGEDPVFRYPVPIGETAATAHALCADALSELWTLRSGRPLKARLEVRAAAASLASFALERLDTDEPPTPSQWEQGTRPGQWHPWGWSSVLAGRNAGNPLVALYPCQDGRWIHLHGGAPHLGERILDVLGCRPSDVAEAVRLRNSFELEEALATSGTSAVVARTLDEWGSHPQGRSLVESAAVDVHRTGACAPRPILDGLEPLSGVRVLDVGDGLAGPTCARLLAQYGADVLQVLEPSRSIIEPFVLDTGRGKRSTMLDLHDADQHDTFASLLATADVLCVALRSGAMAGLGFGLAEVNRIRPGIVVVSINCYGPSGPWMERRGWEQLAQMATGLGLMTSESDEPCLAPAAVCDYTTGYLAGYGALRALAAQRTAGGNWHVQASLCQSAAWLTRVGRSVAETSAEADTTQLDDLLVATPTPYGRLHHLPPPLEFEGIAANDHRAPPVVGEHMPAWAPR